MGSKYGGIKKCFKLLVKTLIVQQFIRLYQFLSKAFIVVWTPLPNGWFLSILDDEPKVCAWEH